MLGNLFFLIHECSLNLRRQGLLVLASVTTTAIALTILGVFTLAAWHVNSIAEALPRRFEVHAFLKPETTREQAKAVTQAVEKLPGVARVKLVPRETAWAEYRQRYPYQKDLEGLTENPLPDKLEITAASPEGTLAIAETVRGLGAVAHVNEGREVLRKLLTIANVVRTGGLILAGLLALGTAGIIGNAIRMTIYARRRDIRVMQLVGATNGSIRLPFLMEGMIEGGLGGFIACAAMFGALYYLGQRVLPDMPFINEFRLALDIPIFCAVLVGGGVILGLFGSMFSLRRFLRTV
jgi:cell division transport system permease protein